MQVEKKIPQTEGFSVDRALRAKPKIFWKRNLGLKVPDSMKNVQFELCDCKIDVNKLSTMSSHA